MNPGALRILALILSIIFLGVMYMARPRHMPANFFDAMLVGIDLFGGLLVAFILGLISGALLALFPDRKKPYYEKFQLAFPLATSLILLILIGIFGYSVVLSKNGKWQSTVPVKYGEIKIPSGMDCASLHDGKFETEELYIERNGSRQVTTKKSSGEKKESRVQWLNECEYTLTLLDDTSKHSMVKITAVKPGNYGCYFIVGKNGNDYAEFVSMKRVQ